MSKRYDQRQAARAVRERLAQERRRRQQLWVSASVIGVLIIAGLLGWAFYANQRPGSYSTPPHASADGSGLTVGSGPVKVDVYVDYLCPFCRMMEQALQDPLDKYVAEGKITVVYHPIAILDDNSSNRYSTRAASAAACAGAEGKIAEYTKALFANQPEEGGAGPSDAQLVARGTAIGLGDTFAKCVDDHTYQSWIAHITDLATAREGYQGTPWVLVAGKTLPADPRDAEQAKKALSDAVAAAG